MNISDIQDLLAYNQWANRRLLEAARSVSAGEFTRDLGASFGSLRGTFIHILWGEWLWVRRWRGESPKRFFADGDYPTLDSLEAGWKAVEQDQSNFIAGVTDERLPLPISYENFQGQRWEYSLAHMMQHLVNHSSYHRGQVVVLLRQLGKRPPTTDFLVYFDELSMGME